MTAARFRPRLLVPALLLLLTTLLLASDAWGASHARHHHRHGKHAHAQTRHAHPHGRHHHDRRIRHRAARRKAKAKATTLAPRLFAPTSVWNQPLTPDAAIDPSSAKLVAALAAEAAREASAGTGPWISTTSYSTPFYVVGPSQPLVRVALDDPTAAWRVGLQGAFGTVPIPADAQPARGTDAQMTVYQPSTDRLWEFWKIRREADGWHAAWGGAIERVSSSPGYYTAASWTGAAPNWGASASSLPLIAGTMTIAELNAGSIDHALAMEVPSARDSVYTWPAQRTDGRNLDQTSLPEGARLRLDPALDVRALKLPWLTERMALAAQRYGIVVRDQSHHSIGFYGEDPTPTGTNPYRPGVPGGFFGGRYPSDLLARFPWRSLRVLRMDLRAGSR